MSLKDFDADNLRDLTHEGRVFIKDPIDEDKDAYKCEILAYVQAIDEFATEAGKGRLVSLWNDIVNAACLSSALVMQKGKQTGHMNRYTVTYIVHRMQSAGVYSKQVTMKTLHLKLERTDTANSYYTSHCGCKLSLEAKKYLKQLFQQL